MRQPLTFFFFVKDRLIFHNRRKLPACFRTQKHFLPKSLCPSADSIMAEPETTSPIFAQHLIRGHAGILFPSSVYIYNCRTDLPALRYRPDPALLTDSSHLRSSVSPSSFTPPFFAFFRPGYYRPVRLIQTCENFSTAPKQPVFTDFCGSAYKSPSKSETDPAADNSGTYRHYVPLIYS